MKKFLAAISLLLFCLTGHSQDNELDKFGYPLYDKVAEFVATNYSVNGFNSREYYRLAKKPDGWYTCVADYSVSPVTYSSYKMCWSRVTKNFVAANAPGNDYEDIMAQLKDVQYEPMNFELNIYYGYRGWTDDVIHFFENAPQLKDEELQTLARAYGHESYYRTGQWDSYSVISRTFKLEDKANSFTPAQLDTFLYYEKKSADTYYRLWKQNPAHENFIGNVYTKYSDEIMSAFLMVAHYQNMAEAVKLLDKEIFDPFLIDVAKNYLNSCPTGAILFTYGDNDTYPLYYVQAKFNYRTDVLIVNHSMLMKDRYINFVREGVFNAAGYPMRLNKKDYAGENLDQLNVSDTKAQEFISNTKLDIHPTTTTFYKNNIAVLDMLAANKGKRPVCFAVSVAPDVFIGLSPYLLSKGLVYEVQNAKQNGNAAAGWDAPVDANFNYQFLMKDMFFTDLRTLPIIDLNVRLISPNYQTIFCRTAKQLLKEGKKTEAHDVLEKCVRIFPNEIIPYGVFMVNAPELLAATGDETKGNMVAELLLQNARKLYDENRNPETTSGKDWHRNLREALYIMQELRTYVQEHFADKTIGRFVSKDYDAKLAEFYEIQKRMGVE